MSSFGESYKQLHEAKFDLFCRAEFEFIFQTRRFVLFLQCIFVLNLLFFQN